MSIHTPDSVGRLRTATALFKRDDFDEVEVVGEGFFSRVLKVWHKEDKQFFVLKLPKEGIRSDNTEQAELTRISLLHELQVLQRLKHPNVLRLIGYCVDGESPNMVIEYANRGTLEELLADKSVVLDLTARVRLVHEIADGLAYVHANCLVHRDLSSKNILIRESATKGPADSGSSTFSAVIADFGLAMYYRNNINRYASLEGGLELHDLPMKQRASTLAAVNTAKSQAKSNNKTVTVTLNDASESEDSNGIATGNEEADESDQQGSTSLFNNSASSLHSSDLSESEKELLSRSEYGSTWWKAPEQIAGNDALYTDRADVYSLGILLAEVLTRLSAVPDPGLIPRHDRQRGFALDFDKFRDHPQVPPETPPLLMSLIGFCCHVEPTRRPTARGAADSLGKVLNDLESSPASSAMYPGFAISNAEAAASADSLSAGVSDAAHGVNRTHRMACKTRSFVANQDRVHGNSCGGMPQRDLFLTVRTGIPDRDSTLEAFKLRRRSVSLSNVDMHSDSPPEM